MGKKSYAAEEEIDLGKYWLVLKRRWFPGILVFNSMIALSVAYVLLQVPKYSAGGQLLFRDDRASSVTGLGSDQNIGDISTLAPQGNPLDTQAEIIRSLPIIEATIKALNLKDADGDLLDSEAVVEELTVKPLAGTDVLQISFASTDPKQAAIVVNQVMKEYITNNINTNRAEATAARQFILQQLPTTERAVREVEESLRQFKEANGIVSLTAESSATVDNLSSLEKSITSAQAELAEVDAKAGQLQRQVGLDAKSSIAISSLNQSAGVQEALTQLQAVQQQLASQRALYREGHPAITALKRQETQLKTLLQQRVGQVVGSDVQVSEGDLQIGDLRQSLISDYVQAEIQRIGVARRVNQLSQAQASYQARSRILPSLEKAERELDRRLTAAQTTYETLLKRLQEVQVTENQTIGNARVISAAIVPESPVSPKKPLILAAGVLVGGLLGVATAFLLDLTDRSVKTLREARELFGYTLLGVIPTIGRSEKSALRSDDALHLPRVISRDFPGAPVQEAYQMLQANLKFLVSDKELKAIVVTSSVPKEGKSEVAASLAASIAQVNRRILLVDANMRQPAQHHAWDLPNTEGLSNLIVGQVSIEEAVQSVTPNLHVLTAGVLPPNPLGLLDSTRMSSLVEMLSEQYDFIIFDTPALAGTADSAVLGKLTDGILLVVRPGVVDSANGRAAKEFLTQSGQQVLGLVVNSINTKNEPDSYFYYTKADRTSKKPNSPVRSSNFKS